MIRSTRAERKSYQVIEKRLEIVEYHEGALSIPVQVDQAHETVWLTQRQMAELFAVTPDNISLHIKNIYREDELDEQATAEESSVVQQEASRRVKRRLKTYNLDMIISVGYRVNSKRGIAFRKWSSDILKQYMLRGYAQNQQRLEQLGKAIQIMQRVKDKLQARQVLDVIQRYESALNLLDDYDHQRIGMPSGNTATYGLNYEECRQLIDNMGIDKNNALFGNEKDDSFRGVIAAVDQTFDGKELYPTLEEKAANLLYFIVKDHSFSDGNKRIGAAVFLHYLDKNDALLYEGEKRIADDTLVALIIMLAESKPQEKQTMVNLVMQFLQP